MPAVRTIRKMQITTFICT